MDTLQRIRTGIAPDIDRLNACMAAQLDTSNPLLSQIVTGSLKTKGKLIRPILVILTARMLGDVTDTVIDAAASVELLHNASLVHDDVVDVSAERRGNPTINAVWGNHVAVLVGDFFVSSSLQLAINTGNMRIVEQVCNLGKDLSLGELDQVYTAYHHNLDEDSYFRIIEYKTASLFVACARMGAYAQGIDDKRADALAEYARLLGICFQMRDDVFDYFADENVGKPTGNDLREGKITLPLLHVLTTCDSPLNNDMRSLALADNISEADIARLTDYAVQNGGIDYTYMRMRQLAKKAAECLEIFEPSQWRSDLLDLIGFIIERNH